MRDAWLAQVEETPIDPGREIVDPHHHLWNRDGTLYELDELWADTGAGQIDFPGKRGIHHLKLSKDSRVRQIESVEIGAIA